jgi:hypothetical protein
MKMIGYKIASGKAKDDTGSQDLGLPGAISHLFGEKGLRWSSE